MPLNARNTSARSINVAYPWAWIWVPVEQDISNALDAADYRSLSYAANQPGLRWDRISAAVRQAVRRAEHVPSGRSWAYSRTVDLDVELSTDEFAIVAEWVGPIDGNVRVGVTGHQVSVTKREPRRWWCPVAKKSVQQIGTLTLILQNGRHRLQAIRETGDSRPLPMAHEGMTYLHNLATEDCGSDVHASIRDPNSWLEELRLWNVAANSEGLHTINSVFSATLEKLATDSKSLLIDMGGGSDE